MEIDIDEEESLLSTSPSESGRASPCLAISVFCMVTEIAAEVEQVAEAVPEPTLARDRPANPLSGSVVPASQGPVPRSSGRQLTRGFEGSEIVVPASIVRALKRRDPPATRRLRNHKKLMVFRPDGTPIVQDARV